MDIYLIPSKTISCANVLQLLSLPHSCPSRGSGPAALSSCTNLPVHLTGQSVRCKCENRDFNYRPSCADSQPRLMIISLQFQRAHSLRNVSNLTLRDLRNYLSTCCKVRSFTCWTCTWAHLPFTCIPVLGVCSCIEWTMCDIIVRLQLPRFCFGPEHIHPFNASVGPPGGIGDYVHAPLTSQQGCS